MTTESDWFALVHRLLDRIQILEDELRVLRNGHAPPTLPPSPVENTMPALTRREIEVARLVCQRITTEAIAAKLVTTVGTVKKHRQNIHKKLGVSEWPALEEMRETWDTEP